MHRSHPLCLFANAFELSARAEVVCGIGPSLTRGRNLMRLMFVALLTPDFELLHNGGPKASTLIHGH